MSDLIQPGKKGPSNQFRVSNEHNNGVSGFCLDNGYLKSHDEMEVLSLHIGQLDDVGYD